MNVYGIDMPAASEFIAHQQSETEIGSYIGADWLLYQTIEDLRECALGINPSVNRFDTSVFDGQYVAGQVDEQYLSRIEALRNDSAKQRKTNNSEIIELHNKG